MDTTSKAGRRKIYLAGPVTGVPDYVERFVKAKRCLEKMGHLVLSPEVLPEGFDYEDYMRITIAMLYICDTIVLLPGWEQSKGTLRELKEAIRTGKEIVQYAYMESFYE